jgi:hypothetical protein
VRAIIFGRDRIMVGRGASYERESRSEVRANTFAGVAARVRGASARHEVRV